MCVETIYTYKYLLRLSSNYFTFAIPRYVQENIQFHELEPMYRQFHRVFEVFKISEKKEDVKEEAGKDTPKPSNKLTEKVQDQFAADEEAVEVCDCCFF